METKRSVATSSATLATRGSGTPVAIGSITSRTGSVVVASISSHFPSKPNVSGDSDTSTSPGPSFITGILHAAIGVTDRNASRTVSFAGPTIDGTSYVNNICDA